MTVDEQAASSVGVTGRSFEAGADEFDEDELTGEERGKRPPPPRHLTVTLLSEFLVKHDLGQA